MSTYYLAISNEFAERMLKRGIPLPKPPQPPMIHAVKSVDSANAMAAIFYGDDFSILEIEGDFPLYEHAMGRESDSVFLTAPVPAAALSRYGRLRHIEEISRGVDPLEGVVSQRTYDDMYGRQFQIRRHLDPARPFSSTGPVHDGEYGRPPRFVPIDARSWGKAEQALDAAVGSNIADLRDLPTISVQQPVEHGSPETPEVHFAQRGLCGVNVEVWYVDQERIDRGSWEPWIEEAGWYWQRMDIAEVHGPFASSDDAVSDVGVNFHEPGRPPRPSDDTYYVGIPST